MKFLHKLTLINLFCLTTFSAVADDSLGQYNQGQLTNNTQDLVKYLKNLGGYFGYDISKSPTANNNSVSQNLINPSAMQLAQMYLYNTFLGAVPVNAFSTALAQFLPNEAKGASALNELANKTFSSQGYSNTSSQQQGQVSVNAAIDQKTYQQDPVSQAVLNILGTPDYSYCMNYDGNAWDSGCNLLFGGLVSANVIGPLPSTQVFYTYQYNQQFLSQLNSNTLLSPLLYSTQNPSSGTSSPTPSSPQNNKGLTAQNQAQQAANFIRYVSGAVVPAKLPKLKDYDMLYSMANPSPTSQVTQIQQMQAQSTLSTYFANLRTYAAQNSVGISNLYYIMSKRLPQNQGDNSSPPSSQAMSEFNMATWRLFNPDQSSNNQWISQINNASSATVEKEIATLLAEINYQMYLDRQLQERILLTNSIMLLQNNRLSQPNTDFASQGAGATSGNPQQQ